MDILTERGQQTVVQERRAAQLLTSAFSDLSYVETLKDRPADVDALLVRDESVVGVIETKCRRMTLEEFRDRYDSEWLVTFEKVMAGRRLAMALRVPFVGMLYLVDSDTLLIQRVCDDDGTFVIPMTVKTTVTQATVNGGEATRTNAYLKLANPTVITGSVQGDPLKIPAHALEAEDDPVQSGGGHLGEVVQ